MLAITSLTYRSINTPICVVTYNSWLCGNDKADERCQKKCIKSKSTETHFVGCFVMVEKEDDDEHNFKHIFSLMYFIFTRKASYIKPDRWWWSYKKKTTDTLRVKFFIWKLWIRKLVACWTRAIVWFSAIFIN
jgi:hypothetical protein